MHLEIFLFSNELKGSAKCLHRNSVYIMKTRSTINRHGKGSLVSQVIDE